MDRKAIREQLRAKRRALSLAEKQSAALMLTQLFCASLWFTSFKRFALYVAADAEIDPTCIVEKLWLDDRKACYLPILSGTEENRFLEFRIYQPTTILVPNRFGIFEPQEEGGGILATELDIVLVPLVAFDLNGNRLGMGSGYYDRTFENLKGEGKKPYLIGLAYEFQKLAHLKAKAWDVPLIGVFTEKRFYPCQESPRTL